MCPSSTSGCSLKLRITTPRCAPCAGSRLSKNARSPLSRALSSSSDRHLGRNLQLRRALDLQLVLSLHRLRPPGGRVRRSSAAADRASAAIRREGCQPREAAGAVARIVVHQHQARRREPQHDQRTTPPGRVHGSRVRTATCGPLTERLRSHSFSFIGGRRLVERHCRRATKKPLPGGTRLLLFFVREV